jgi:hypothetical protein
MRGKEVFSIRIRGRTLAKHDNLKDTCREFIRYVVRTGDEDAGIYKKVKGRWVLFDSA